MAETAAKRKALSGVLLAAAGLLLAGEASAFRTSLENQGSAALRAAPAAAAGLAQAPGLEKQRDRAPALTTAGREPSAAPIAADVADQLATAYGPTGFELLQADDREAFARQPGLEEPRIRAPALEAPPALTAAIAGALAVSPPIALELDPATWLEDGATEKLASGKKSSLDRNNLWSLQELAAESQQAFLAYARARWYDPRNASWLSEDPLGDVDSPNLYAFVGWRPHMATDPLGLEETYEMKQQQCGIVKQCGTIDLSDPKAQATIQAFAGGLQLAAAFAALLAPEPTGVTKVAGYTALVRGLDNVFTGVRNRFSVEHHSTLSGGLIRRGFSALGHDTEAAGRATAVTEFLLDVGSASGAAGVRFKSGLAPGGNLRHAAQVSNVGELDDLIIRLGERAVWEGQRAERLLGLAGQEAGAYAEGVFAGYLRGVSGRLARHSSPFIVEWQPATLPGYGRVPPFVEFGGGGTYPFPGSLRMDAALSDSRFLVSTPAVSADTYPTVLRGYDITLDLSKVSAQAKYSMPFGGIPVADIRPR